MGTTSRLLMGRCPEGFVVRVEGKGTMRESPAVHDFAVQALSADHAALIVDLSACEHVDSTFLGCLLGLHRQLGGASQPRVRVAAPTESCLKIIKGMKLDQVLRIVQELPAVDGEWMDVPAAMMESRELGRHILECHRRLAELGGANEAAFRPVVEQLSKELEG